MVAAKSVAAIAALSLINTAQAWYHDLPPCLAPFDPFVYTGCYDNGQPGQKEALSLRTDLDSQNMTVETCVADCKGNGYRLAGLSYYGVCYCGNTVSTALLPEDQCSYPCTGNSSETCGGDTQINIWMDPTFPPIEDQTDISEYVPVGCWTDDSSDGKALFYRQDNLDSASMTTETCLQSCLSGGFPFAGTEYGGECYCGVVVGNGTALAADSTTCSNSCNGNSSEICGGPARLSLYVAKDLQSLEPCGTPPDTSSTVTTPPATSSYPVSSSTTSESSATTPESSSTTPVSSSTPGYPVSSSTTPVSSSTPGYPVSSSTTTKTSSTTPGYPVSSSTTTKTSSTTPGYPVSSSTTTTKSSTTPGYPVSSSTTTTKSSTTPGYPVSSSTTTTKSSTPGYPVSSSTTKTSSTTQGYPTSTTVKSSTTPGYPTGYPTTRTTTTVKTTTTTSSAAVCTTTYVTPPTCEYQCGKWCSNPIPDWNDHGSCLTAWSQCVVQTASCFLHAGFPDALNCFEFGNWCSSVKDYCGNQCSGGKCGGKSDCYKSSPPHYPTPPVTHTSTIPCPTTTTTKVQTTLTTAYPTASCPVPTPTGVCIQPTNKYYGYGPGNPVGGIDLPIVTCNNLKADWDQGFVFKLFTSKDSNLCPSYQRPQCASACADACKAQLQQCQDVYAEGCKTNRFSQSYTNANAACQAQYDDCTKINWNIVDTQHCTTWKNSC